MRSERSCVVDSQACFPPPPRNLFQNIEALSTALGKATGRSLAEALGEEEYASLVRMFQVRHMYEHNLGVVDAEAIKRVPGLATWKGRKYVLARNEVQAFLRSLGGAYDVVVRVLIAASSRPVVTTARDQDAWWRARR
jgi:hypothetical protein